MNGPSHGARACVDPFSFELVGGPGPRPGTRERVRCARGRATRLVDTWRSVAVPLLTVYFGTPNMFITLWFGFDYGTNPPLGTLII
jgi:hypothetical protein